MAMQTIQRSYHKRARANGPHSDPSSVLSMLREFIEEGGYTPGMVLPAERVLAEKLGVGRPAIREGIKALSILDVLESRRGDGTYIKSLEGLRVGWPARVELRRTDVNLLDLLEVRKMLEPNAARLAATRANESQMQHIEEECSRIEKAADWSSIAEHDLLLHTAIIEAAGNPILNELNNALTRLLRRSREITGASAPDCRQMIDHHRNIVDAILKGEGDEAEHAMLEHLHHVGLDLISNRRR
jgi:GntR family transcriptional regulator, transcriptional repressor for pyruvate dehydrogenase complex